MAGSSSSASPTDGNERRSHGSPHSAATPSLRPFAESLGSKPPQTYAWQQSVGNLTPQYIIVGEDVPKNVGITAFSIARNEERPDQMQAICRVENFGVQKVDSVRVSIYLNDESIDLQDKRLNQQLLSFLLRNQGEIFETPVQFFSMSPLKVKRTTVWDGARSVLTILSVRLRRAEPLE